MLKFVQIAIVSLFILIGVLIGYFKLFDGIKMIPLLMTTSERTPRNLDSLISLESFDKESSTLPSVHQYLSGSELGNFANHYSKRQAWNTKETLILASDGTVHRVDGGKSISNVTMSSELVWSNIDPYSIYGIQNMDGVSNRFVKWNVDTNVITELYYFEELTDVTIGQWEGNISNNDGHIVFYGFKGDVPTLISFSISTLKVMGSMNAEPNFNWAGVSQRGEWILVENNKYPDPNAQLLRYEIDFTGETLIVDKPNHGDFCIDSEGDEVYAMTGKKIYWVKLDSGEQFEHQLTSDLYGHLSCRALDRPGWAYLSIDVPNGLIGAVPLIADFDQWEPWGRHYSTAESYNAQPKASVSKSGHAIIFSSDLHEDNISAFEFRLQADLIPTLSF